MIDVYALPHLNAVLNAIAMTLLMVGYPLIRAGFRDHHRKVMLSAAAVSGLFLVSYLVYHFHAPIYPFHGQGGMRTFYYVVLISHVVLAAVAAPMVLLTLYRALKGRFDRHRAIARWTYPVWLYVSVTGIVIYAMLYHFNPPAP